MPSTHSTALTFYWVYLLLMIPSLTPIVIRSLDSVSGPLSSILALLPLPHSLSQEMSGVLGYPAIPPLGALVGGIPSLSVGRVLLGTALTGLWAAGLWSRVELGYHTPQQVLGGAALGAVLAPAWALVWATNPAVRDVIQRSIDTAWKEVVGRVLG